MEAENGMQGVKVNSHVTPAQFSGTVWFLPENLASLWFPEVSYTCTVASNPCSHTLYCMNPRTEHDYVPSWRKGHRLPCCGELCTEEAQHPTWDPIPWASHLTRRTTFLGYLLTIRHSVTREHLPRPKSQMSSPPLFYALLGTFPFLFSGTYHCGLILCRAGVGCTESEALRENGLGLFISGPKTCLPFSYN